MDLRELGRVLLMLGVILVIAGSFFFFGGKFPFRLGKLPGDISYKSEHAAFYFPIVTCIILSIGLSLILWLINHFRR